MVSLNCIGGYGVSKQRLHLNQAMKRIQDLERVVREQEVTISEQQQVVLRLRAGTLAVKKPRKATHD
jgi:hypothetical protein